MPTERIRNSRREIRAFEVKKNNNLMKSKTSKITFRREVYGTGLEVVVTMELLGFAKAGMAEIEKARREIGVKIEKCDKGSATFTVILNQVEKILYQISSVIQDPLPP